MSRLLVLLLLLVACSPMPLSVDAVYRAARADQSANGLTYSRVPPESLRAALQLPPFSQDGVMIVTEGRGVRLEMAAESSLGSYLMRVQSVSDLPPADAPPPAPVDRAEDGPAQGVDDPSLGSACKFGGPGCE